MTWDNVPNRRRIACRRFPRTLNAAFEATLSKRRVEIDSLYYRMEGVGESSRPLAVKGVTAAMPTRLQDCGLSFTIIITGCLLADCELPP